MPTAILLAGPNGAGKTTFASAYLRTDASSFVFINADEIAARLDPVAAKQGKDVQAGRLMLDRLEEILRSRRSFVVETTLSSASYARRIPVWRAGGYEILLIYLRLPNVEASLERVRQRAASGGHSIPERDIKRRFDRSLNLLEMVYKPLVDDWTIYESRHGSYHLTDRKRGR